jgi:hypothetical protein
MAGVGGRPGRSERAADTTLVFFRSSTPPLSHSSTQHHNTILPLEAFITYPELLSASIIDSLRHTTLPEDLQHPLSPHPLG